MKTFRTLGGTHEAASGTTPVKAAVPATPASATEKAPRVLASRTTVAAATPTAAATPATAASTATPSGKPGAAQTLDEKLRSIDALNNTIKDAVSFVGTVAASRGGGIAAGAKGNPFNYLLSTEDLAKTDGEEEAMSPRRGGRVTKPAGGASGVVTTASSAAQPSTTATATAFASSKRNAGESGQSSGLTPPRRAQASAVSAPTSALRNARSVAHSTTHGDSDRENASASTANVGGAGGSATSTMPTRKVSALPRTPTRTGASSKLTTSRSQPTVITAPTEPSDKETKREEEKPKTRPVSSNPFSFAIE